MSSFSAASSRTPLVNSDTDSVRCRCESLTIGEGGSCCTSCWTGVDLPRLRNESGGWAGTMLVSPPNDWRRIFPNRLPTVLATRVNSRVESRSRPRPTPRDRSDRLLPGASNRFVLMTPSVRDRHPTRVILLLIEICIHYCRHVLLKHSTTSAKVYGNRSRSTSKEYDEATAILPVFAFSERY